MFRCALPRYSPQRNSPHRNSPSGDLAMNVHRLNPNSLDPTGARSFPSVSYETKLLVELLSTQPEGTIVKYAEMAELIGRPVIPKSDGYRYLASARRILARDYAVIIDAEPKVGVRVCTNEEKMLVSGRDMKRARRAVQRSRQKLTTVAYERLDDAKKREWNARMSLVGAIALMSAPKAIAKIEKAVSTSVLPSAKTLELFQR
jgi:hypothetical protein